MTTSSTVDLLGKILAMCTVERDPVSVAKFSKQFTHSLYLISKLSAAGPLPPTSLTNTCWTNWTYFEMTDAAAWVAASLLNTIGGYLWCNCVIQLCNCIIHVLHTSHTIHKVWQTCTRTVLVCTTD